MEEINEEKEESESLLSEEQNAGEKSEEETEDEEEEEQQDDEGRSCGDKWEGRKFVWTKEELEEANKAREDKREIRAVSRDPDAEYHAGIRAGVKMTWSRCLWSLLVPWHNDWLATWIYIAFGLYFLIESFIIMAREHSIYKFERESNYNYMFIATLGIAISLFTTAGFLVLYPRNQKWRDRLEGYDYMGKLIMIFFYSFAFVGSELEGTKAYFPLEFFIAAILIANLAMTQYTTGRVVSFWVSIALLLAVYLYDFLGHSNPRQKQIFYIPLFVELLILGAGYLLSYFQVPERFCRKAKFVQLYLTGCIFFTIILMNFVFEAQVILYYTIKYNAGNYNDEEDDWWRLNNLFNRD